MDLVAACYQRVGIDRDLADNAKEEEMFHTSETNGAEGCKEKGVTRGFSVFEKVLGCRNVGSVKVQVVFVLQRGISRIGY